MREKLSLNQILDSLLEAKFHSEKFSRSYFGLSLLLLLLPQRTTLFLLPNVAQPLQMKKSFLPWSVCFIHVNTTKMHSIGFFFSIQLVDCKKAQKRKCLASRKANSWCVCACCVSTKININQHVSVAGQHSISEFITDMKM